MECSNSAEINCTLDNSLYIVLFIHGSSKVREEGRRGGGRGRVDEGKEKREHYGIGQDIHLKALKRCNSLSLMK